MKHRTPEKQKAYYEQTATQYHEMHVGAGDEHFRALHYIAAISELRGLSSFLDVGSGTGRAVHFLHSKGFDVKGVEPVEALIDQADPSVRKLITCGHGESLPFPDGSFDAVCEFGVLHHVQRPEPVIKEMVRVVRKAVFLSDANRFGQGQRHMRLLKLLLSKAGAWQLANLLQTRGNIYRYSEGDGYFYSYSVYDSLAQLAEWAQDIHILPLVNQRSSSWFQPLLTSAQVLMCAYKQVQLADDPKIRKAELH